MRTRGSQHGAAGDGGIELISLGDERHGRRLRPPASAARAGAASGNKYARSAQPVPRRATTCLTMRSAMATAGADDL